MADIRVKPRGDERFVYIAHRHWSALLIRELIPIVAALGCVGLLAVRFLNREPDFLGRPLPLLDAFNVTLAISLLVVVAIATYIYFDWRNDHLIISNKRVVHEDRTLWLSYQYETIPIEQVQNVNIRIDNVFQHLLKYGRIEVQAAGPTEPIIFERADRPAEIQKRLLNEVQREKRTQEQTRLAATVERRLNPKAPPVPPIHVEAADQIKPLGGSFQTLLPLGPQLQGGTIIWHRHWIVLVINLIWPTLALLLWVGLAALLPRVALLEPTTTTIVLFVLFVLILLFFFWQYDDWRNDIYILEPTKVVDVQRLPFGLFERRNEAPLGGIQNVNASSPNLIARMLGYGDVLIETAGKRGDFTFDDVPDPDQVLRIVFEYRERFRWMQREREWTNTLDIVHLMIQANNDQQPPQP
jgi:uncharacterized membrane protein YdbT with pleckstrin-like domain